MAHPHAPPVATMVELLAHRAQTQPDRIGYTFLADGERDEHNLTYGQLHRRSLAVASWLQARGNPGDTVLLTFHEGTDYLVALFGCMAAGMLAVPVHPPDPQRLHRTLPRLVNIASDAGVSFVLTSAELLKHGGPTLKDANETLGAAAWLAVDEIDESLADAWQDPGATAETIAYLQYTSGSTALPKGVMVSHHNLIHQLHDFDTGYDHDPNSVIVAWLPATHDLGLVYGRFMPLFIGLRCVFFSPGRFMQKPIRWMQALHNYRGTHSPSPNFGFEVAARKSDPAELAKLDLSHVKVLLNGAEAIRQESEELFIERMAAAKLPPAAVTHAMGMSESTAKIITEPIDRFPAKFVYVDSEAYLENIVKLVPRGTPGSVGVASNGNTVLDTVVAIADPHTFERQPEGRVGEMWVKGTTVAQGYHNRPEATKESFQAHLSDGDGPYLRTGDLAFIHEGEVYLSGRLKDVVILRGQNHHPQDIEWAMGTAHPALRPNCAAAFGISTDEGEALALVTEVYPNKMTDPEEVFRAIRSALSDQGIAAATLVLIAPRALPKTSSGKIQRTKAKQWFHGGELEVVARWDAAAKVVEAPVEKASALLVSLQEASGRKRKRLLIAHLQGVAAKLLSLDASDVEADQPLKELGLDSVTAVDMVESVGKSLGMELEGTLLFDHPTLEGLAMHLLGELF